MNEVEDAQISIVKHAAIWKVSNRKSDTDLAKAIGISRTALHEKMTGAREWRFPSEIFAMCRVFDCSPEQLIGMK